MLHPIIKVYYLPNPLCLKILSKFLLLFRYEPMLISKPLMMLFCPFKILRNSCRFFLYCQIAELRRNFEGQKSICQGFKEINVARFAHQMSSFGLFSNTLQTLSVLRNTNTKVLPSEKEKEEEALPPDHPHVALL